MTSRDDLAKRREAKAERIAISLARQKGERRSTIKGGEGTVAWVTENLCIGCDQCTIVCDDDAIELYSRTWHLHCFKFQATEKRELFEMLAQGAGCVC